jgi:hypothetical protein
VLGEVDRFGRPGIGLGRSELAEGTVLPPASRASWRTTKISASFAASLRASSTSQPNAWTMNK